MDLTGEPSGIRTVAQAEFFEGVRDEFHPTNSAVTHRCKSHLGLRREDQEIQHQVTEPLIELKLGEVTTVTVVPVQLAPPFVTPHWPTTDHKLCVPFLLRVLIQRNFLCRFCIVPSPHQCLLQQAAQRWSPAEAGASGGEDIRFCIGTVGITEALDRRLHSVH